MNLDSKLLKSIMENPSNKENFMREAIAISVENIHNNIGGPFGAVIVRNGEILARGSNRVTSDNDPTAHAEMVAIRNACKEVNNFSLEDCEIYTSCEPCPMCLSAIYWAGIKKVYYGNTKLDAADIQFNDNFIYEELVKPIENRALATEQILHEESIAAFKMWEEKEDKVRY